MGHLLSTTTSNDTRTLVTHDYDLLGRLRTTVDPDSGTWKYGYDANGNLVYRDDPKTGQHVEWAFDALDRPTVRCLLGWDTGYFGQCNAATPEVESTFSYDSTTNGNFGIGRLTGAAFDRIDGVMVSGDALIYDAQGRVIASARTIKSKTATMGFAFDAGDHLLALSYPDGEVVTNSYDAAGQLESSANTSPGAERIYVASAAYDLFGRATEIEHGNGPIDQLEYYDEDEGFRLKKARTQLANSAAVDLEYLYREFGKVREIQDHRDDGSSDPVLWNLSADATYAYDGLGRLSGVDWRGAASTEHDETFEYDTIGNLSSKNGHVISYFPVRPHRASGIAGTAGYGYDGNGNQTSRYTAATAVTQVHTFDRLDRLVSIEASGQTTTFGYDPSDERAWKTRPDGATIRYFSAYAESRDGLLVKFYFAGERLIATVTKPGVDFPDLPPDAWTPRAPSPPWLVALLLSSFGVVVVLIVFAPGAGERRIGIWVAPGRALGTSALLLLGSTPLLLVTGCDGPVVRHYHLDALGSVVAKTAEKGSLVRHVRYLAYGQERGHYNASGNATAAEDADRHEWTGQETEHEAELIYMGARYYDPALGQFLSLDPARQYASPYAYGPGDPM